MKKIVLTGGGTAGHVTPNMALIPQLKQQGYNITYVGSYNGIERKLMADYDIPYVGISSGKLRRYHSLQNFKDPFKVLKGYHEAHAFMKKWKPDIVFSKGGFVSVPIVMAAKHLHIPAIIHESDITPGLANKLAIRGAVKVCCNFPETLPYLPQEKAVLTGSPIRRELLEGDASKGLGLCGFTTDKPVLLVTGGSSGSAIINQNIRQALPELLKEYQIIHICGSHNLDNDLQQTIGYRQFEYVGKELADLFAAATLVVSRAGANTICELLALHKPTLLIPLSAKSSRGDQILNAKSFKKQGFCLVLEEELLSKETLLEQVFKLYKERDIFIQSMRKSKQGNGIDKVLELIVSETK